MIKTRLVVAGGRVSASTRNAVVPYRKTNVWNVAHHIIEECLKTGLVYIKNEHRSTCANVRSLGVINVVDNTFHTPLTAQ